MEKDEIDTYVARFKERKSKCLYHKEAYDIWLGILTPLRWVSIVIIVVFSAVAGASVFTDIFGGVWNIWSSSLLLIAGIVSGLHTKLKCESHQAKCLKLMTRYEVLADKYGEAIKYQPDDIKKEFENLDKQMDKLKIESDTKPLKWCFNKARKKLNYEGN